MLQKNLIYVKRMYTKFDSILKKYFAGIILLLSQDKRYKITLK